MPCTIQPPRSRNVRVQFPVGGTTRRVLTMQTYRVHTGFIRDVTYILFASKPVRLYNTPQVLGTPDFHLNEYTPCVTDVPKCK